MPVNLGIDIQHSDLAEELGTVLESGLVIRFNDRLTNFFLDLLLSFSIVRVCVLKLEDSFLLCSLLVELVLEPLADNLLQVGRVAGNQSRGDLLILGFDTALKMCIGCIHRPDSFALLSDALILRIVEHLVEHLVLGHGRRLLLGPGVGEKVEHQVLVGLVKIRRLKVDHVVVLDSVVLNDLVGVDFEDLLTVVQNLALGVDRGLDSDQALELFDGGVGRDLDAVEFVCFRKVLD